MENPYISFNKMFIIESLDKDETQTGTNLADNLNEWVPSTSGIQVELIKIKNIYEWENFFDQLSIECESNKLLPLLHFEIHGDTEKGGLILTNGDHISNERFGEYLRHINSLTGCNLFITLAVCYGLYSLFNMHAIDAMPFCGAVGSFDVLYSDDIEMRYAEFYSELFSSFDVTKAYDQLKNANPNKPDDYQCYMADELFYRIYDRYIREQCNPNALESRITPHIKTKSREERHKMKLQFKIIEKRTRNKEYRKVVNKFFMLDKFPNNEKRFNIPLTTEELQKRYVTVQLPNLSKFKA